jgi:hypothetical protein
MLMWWWLRCDCWWRFVQWSSFAGLAAKAASQLEAGLGEVVRAGEGLIERVEEIVEADEGDASAEGGASADGKAGGAGGRAGGDGIGGGGVPAAAGAPVTPRARSTDGWDEPWGHDSDDNEALATGAAGSPAAGGDGEGSRGGGDDAEEDQDPEVGHGEADDGGLLGGIDRVGGVLSSWVTRATGGVTSPTSVTSPGAESHRSGDSGGPGRRPSPHEQQLEVDLAACQAENVALKEVCPSVALLHASLLPQGTVIAPMHEQRRFSLAFM